MRVQSSTDNTTVEAVCRKFDLEVAEFLELRTRSSAAKETAYCPYSNFRVGAVVVTALSKYIPGANVENAAYPVGTCAERVALAKAVTEGHLSGFKALAVSTDVAPPASPCGMCRQFIREFCDLKMPIIMFDKNADFVIMRLEELLPLSFGPENLLPSQGAAAVIP